MTPNPQSHNWRLAEVWGDTVDLKHLAWAIVIGTGISVTAYFFASRWLTSVVESKQLAQAYAMLAGLAGCVISGVISGVGSMVGSRSSAASSCETKSTSGRVVSRYCVARTSAQRYCA